MADYISREAAITFAEHAYHEWNLAMGAADGQRQINRCFKMQELCKAVASVFENAPTVDAVPVVRCRECRHYDGEYCTNPYGLKLPGPKSFCDCGQRRDQSADVSNMPEANL